MLGCVLCPVRDDGTLALDQLFIAHDRSEAFRLHPHLEFARNDQSCVRSFVRKRTAVGALTLVDAAQSAGHLPIDVRELGCDFLAFSGHKMCGPTGIGALYARAEILNSIPPWHGGGEMIVSVTLEKSAFKKAPHRFEAGTPNIAGAIGLAAAIDYIEQIGRASNFRTRHASRHYAVERLAELPGMRILGPLQAAWRSRRFRDGCGASARSDNLRRSVRAGLARRAPLQSAIDAKVRRPGTTRASFYFYNTNEEIDRMIEILHAAVRFFHESRNSKSFTKRSFSIIRDDRGISETLRTPPCACMATIRHAVTKFISA